MEEQKLRQEFLRTTQSPLKPIYEAVRKIISKGELGLVGGCVRDVELGLEPKDYDFCTNLTPDEVEELAKQAGRHVYTVGKKYGTIGFKVLIEEYNDYGGGDPAWFGPQWHMMGRWVNVEVTTYRTEHYQNGSRKPEVEFGTDLREDLMRRDFTINAMWYGSKDPSEEPMLLDLFNGRLDLDARIIKAVQDPKKMIDDDPLRILRAIRFACQYNFNIEPNLLGVCGKGREKLWNVAIERQVVELDKIFSSSNASRGLEFLKRVGILDMLLPELVQSDFPLSNENPDWAWQNLLHYVGGYMKQIDYAPSYYVYDKHKHDFLCKGICARFRFSNKRTKIILGGE